MAERHWNKELGIWQNSQTETRRVKAVSEAYEQLSFMDRLESEDTIKLSDVVDHPPHYNTSGIECIDAMKAMSENCPVDAHSSYCWQNCFKYLWRWPYKNGLEDLKKARWYLDRLISEVENDGD